jgi:hypothetical protein
MVELGLDRKVKELVSDLEGHATEKGLVDLGANSYSFAARLLLQ